jgi:pimeloyl-ACP methyl ester carboxylesterase
MKTARAYIDVDQDIRFCTAPDGVRLAYATSGAGPPLLKAANWLNHLQYDWESPVWRHMFRELSRDRLLVRYDERGNGMSDWNVEDLSFGAWVRDLETVVDAAGVDRFALLGISQGAAVSIAYCVSHPERVTHLVLLGGWARGWGLRAKQEIEIREALTTLIRAGWGRENAAFRQVFTSRFMPGGSLAHQRWFNELQRRTTSPENAARLSQTTRDVDVTELLPQLTVPTLVLHARGDAVVGIEYGRELATGIPDARFVELEGENHLLTEDEPAFEVFLRETRRFLGTPPPALPDTAAPWGTSSSVASSKPRRLEVGTSLGHYRIESVIGEGGMGVVYRATDTKLLRPVALKVLSDTTSGAEPRRRLLREARNAAALNHPNICTIHEVAHADHVDFIVMELVPGRVLRALTVAGPLPTEQVEALGAQIADALTHAHERGVVHGDLKSANVVVRDDGRAKVLDFGIARRIEAIGAEGTTLADPTASRIVGTPAYMAPEVLSGALPDPRSDIWSLGVLLFEMATGRLPFRGEGLDLAAAILRDPPPLPRRGVPAEMRDIIGRCLDKEPGRRPSAAEVRRTLQFETERGFPLGGGLFER